MSCLGIQTGGRRLPVLSLAFAVAATAAATLAAPAAQAGEEGILERLHRHTTLASTVPANGDENPYAIFVASVSAGKLQQGDVLVDNFNDKNNLQGLGTTIVDLRPSTRALTLFASIPRRVAMSGWVGLTTAMTI